MLKPVKKNQELKGAIAQTANYSLEAVLIGIPLWLQRHGHESDALTVARFISQQPQDLFVRHTHRLMWTAYGSLASRDLPPTEAWVEQILSDAGEWSSDEASRGAITAGLLDELSEQGRCGHQIKIDASPMSLVREIAGDLWSLRRRRRVIHAVEDLHNKVTTQWNHSNEQAVAQSIEELQEKFSERRDKEETAATFDQLVRADIRTLEHQLAGEEQPQRILTGFRDVDRLTGGFRPGNLATLGGRSSMGKTSLAAQFAWNIAKQGRVTLYYTFEMTCMEVAQRIVAWECRISPLRMRNGDLEAWHVERYKQILGNGSEAPLILDQGNFTANRIEARIRDFNTKLHPARVDCVVIDHLQLMGNDDTARYERRDLKLATYTGQLKDIAKRLSIPILLLSQLNRRSAEEQREPRLSDLRESGSIEQDSDIVMGLYRPWIDTKNPDEKGVAYLLLMKNRSGPIGRLNLAWNPDLMKFSDPDGSQADQAENNQGFHMDVM